MEKSMWERQAGLAFTVSSAIIQNHQSGQRSQTGYHIVIPHKDRRIHRDSPALKLIDQIKLQAIQVWILVSCRQPRRERRILQVAVQSAAYPPVERRRSIASEQPVYVEAVFEHVGRSPQFAFIEL